MPDPVGVPGKGLEQRVFTGCQRARLVLLIAQDAIGEVQRPFAEARDLMAARFDARATWRRQFAAGTAQQRAHPGQQFARIEGLHQVIVGGQLKSEDAVGFVALAGEDHDRNGRSGTHATRQRQPVFAAQAQVKNEQIVTAAFEFAAHRGAIVHGGRQQAIGFDEVAQQFAHVDLIVDDQYMRDGVYGHECSVRRRWPTF